jgi:signal transduction histidine kinase
MVIILYISSLLHFILSIYIYKKNSKAKINQYFALFSSGVAFWALTNGFYQESQTQFGINFWTNAAYTAATFMLTNLMSFANSFTERKISSTSSKLFNILSWVSYLIVYIPFIGAQGASIETRAINLWPGQSILFVTYLYYMIGSLVILYQGYKKSKSKKQQTLSVFIGVLLTVISGTAFNIILPTLEIYDFVTIGPSFTIILLSFIAYSLLRYRMFDTRLVIGKAIYYILLATPAYLIYFLLALIYESLWGTSLTAGAYLVGIPNSLIFVYVFNYLKDYFQSYTDTKLINPGYNPLTAASDLNEKISSFLQIEKIAGTALETIQKTIRPDFSGIVVITSSEPLETKSYSYKNSEPVHGEDLTFIIDFWENLGLEPLIFEDLEYQLNAKYRNAPHLIHEVKKLMKEKELRAFIPLTQNEKLAGILLLGPKEADTQYNSQDISFLSKIATTISLSLGRALLYEQSLEFTRTLENKVKEATEELEDKNSSLEMALVKLEDSRRQERDMIDVMGHELRTPLSIVRNALLVLNKDFEKDRKIETEKLERYLRMGIESIRREVTLVETLLSATKFEGKRIQLQLTKVDLVDVVEDSIEGHKYRAEEKDLELTFDKPDHEIWVYADRVRIQEIMDNFLSNAIKYTAEGGVKINITTNEKYSRINVIDSGIGIAQDEVAKLGKKFFRAKKIFGEKDLYVHPSGTGLGLYVTFQLIEVMNGNRIITSEIGKGSTFSFEMPNYKGQEDKMVDQTFLEDDTLDKLRQETGKTDVEPDDAYITKSSHTDKLPNGNPDVITSEMRISPDTKEE